MKIGDSANNNDAVLLFQDLLNFEDPLNAAASEEYRLDKEKFVSHVKQLIKANCSQMNLKR